MHLEEELVDGHHGRRLGEELMGGGEEVEVAAVLARLGEEAGGCPPGGMFDFEADKAEPDVVKEIKALI